MTHSPEKAMTTFIIDVESMKAVATNLVKTFSHIKLRMLSSVLVISVGGFFMIKRIFAAEEIEENGDNQQGMIQSQLI